MAGAEKTLTRDPDVLDTWFSSGLWPIGTLGWPEQTEALEKYHSTDVLVTGQDILFFWVARMMMMQLAVVDEIRFTRFICINWCGMKKARKCRRPAAM